MTTDAQLQEDADKQQEDPYKEIRPYRDDEVGQVTTSIHRPTVVAVLPGSYMAVQVTDGK